ncbi:MAG: AFG1 family ATPase [Burkholderiales bacterium]|nr:AFG1 family ATPase [Burkholderiales bacterium]
MRDSAFEPEDDSIEDINLAAEAGELTVLDYYEKVVARRGYVSDEAQQAAVRRLQELYDEWVGYKARRNTRLKRIFVKPELPRGVYLWGGVGRGKSFLMDSFYLCVPLTKKRRVHFHHFMRDVHQALDELKGQEDPLAILARDIAEKYRLICFDEFHVNDIADAMILGRLLQHLFDNRVMLCMTSNYHPDLLWKDGLQRAKFVPAIELIKARLDVINVDAGVDYRRRALEVAKVYHTPITDATDLALAAEFDRIAEVADETQELDVEGRRIPYVRRAGGVVWFDFDTLCAGPRSYTDYVDLARRFHTIVLSDVPEMGPRQAAAARRFTWLIDVMYDARVKMILSAAVPPERLYTQGALAHEFARTLSRIEEMQTVDYLRLPRLEQHGFRDAGEAAPAGSAYSTSGSDSMR